MNQFDRLVAQVRACEICRADLPFGPRPVFQLHPKSKILLVGQAPGKKVHESGIPFNDASGNRLRDWLGVTPAQFYGPEIFAILPMGFCYPGTGAAGDFPPRPECAAQWRTQLLSHLQSIELTVVIGQYAHAYHLNNRTRSVTEQVMAWQDYWPQSVPLPHPSPRNNRWLLRNPWFEKQLLPKLQLRVAEVLG